MQAKISTRTRVTRSCEIRLNREDLLTAVQQVFEEHGNDSIPDDAEIAFNVPGGGDWSSMSIDINDENPVVISWTEESGYDN